MEKLIIEQLKQGNEDAFKYIYKPVSYTHLTLPTKLEV